MANKLLGWQDIIIEVPTNWQITHTKLKVKKKLKNKTGVIVFWESSRKLLELRWLTFDHKKKPNKETIIDDYIKSIKKENKSLEEKNKGKGRIFDHDYIRAIWEIKKNKISGFITVWVCEKSYKIIICQSQFLENANSEMVEVKKVINSIKCHKTTNYSIWSGPNLQLSTPRNMLLIENKFLIGHSFIHLVSKLDDFPFNIIAFRIGLANQKVSDSNTLPEWYKEYIIKTKFDQIISKYSINTFEKFLFEKVKPIWKDIFITNKSKIFSQYYFETYLWMNEEKNDIYIVIYYGKEKNKSEIEIQIKKLIKKTIHEN